MYWKNSRIASVRRTNTTTREISEMAFHIEVKDHVTKVFKNGVQLSHLEYFELTVGMQSYGIAFQEAGSSQF